MQKLWLIGASLLAIPSAYAEDTTQSQTDIEVPSPWTTEVEFGYQAHDGNTESESLNTRMNAEYVSGRYRTNGEWRFYNLYKDGEEDKNQSTYSIQSDYKLSPKTYLYGSFQGNDSKYTAYFKDYTLSAGLGYQFSYTDDFKLEVEVGPGFRYQEPNLDEIDDDEIVFPDIVEEGIFRGNIASTWQALEHLSLSADITIVTGHSNTRTDLDLSATNDITDHIALKFSYDQTYHDKVPEGLDKSDSIFSVNILFSF
ncbi:DUF481 domain-containing protein [Vibrio sp. SCSIO 43135]|uniref:DUF481 domain-containing protein n=1 Tax=Vibrio paucivorans TaxID=2829489 RepID=A0A9X3CHN0_9VIBR|nr:MULTISPECIES: DUF481 domain-containing protein [Vibrio]MCW8335992.1 DUF481 domain-containing protein [Vibrio paucivorans]USD42595.1 DUF481 domain-containing protein [Vibrio sp. SCSIO 43135]